MEPLSSESTDAIRRALAGSLMFGPIVTQTLTNALECSPAGAERMLRQAKDDVALLLSRIEKAAEEVGRQAAASEDAPAKQFLALVEFSAMAPQVRAQ